MCKECSNRHLISCEPFGTSILVVNGTLLKFIYYYYYYCCCCCCCCGLTSYAVVGKEWKIIFSESSLFDTRTSYNTWHFSFQTCYVYVWYEATKFFIFESSAFIFIYISHALNKICCFVTRNLSIRVCSLVFVTMYYGQWLLMFWKNVLFFSSG
jgi:hypothetical protein